MGDRRMNFHSSILQVASIIKNKDQIKAKQKLELEKKKRDRTANYSKAETDRLVDLIILKKEILECKKNNADLWNEKREAWDDIAREFNKKPLAGETCRDSKTLRIKYESLKRDVKRKWSMMSKRKKINGKPPKFSAAERRIKDLILSSLPMDGFCDFNSIEDNNDIISCGDEDDSKDSCISDSNIEDIDISVKKEVSEISDEECPINFDESHYKVTRQDPLVGNQNRTIDEDEIKSEELKRKLQIEMLKEDLEIKKLQRRMIEQEFEQKKTMHELEKQHLLLKIKALKNSIE